MGIRSIFFYKTSVGSLNVLISSHKSKMIETVTQVFKIFRIICGLVVLVVFFVHSANAETGNLRLIEQELGRTAAFSGNFTQEYYDSLQNKSNHSEGTFAFMQPRLMKWTYQKPENLEIIVGHKTIWIYDPDLDNVTIRKIDQASGLESLAFLYEPGSLKVQFTEITSKKPLLDKSPDIISIFLIPKKKNPNMMELQLGYDKKSHQIRQFVIIDAGGNYRKITFKEINTNPELDQAEFHFVITEDMEVIDEFTN